MLAREENTRYSSLMLLNTVDGQDLRDRKLLEGARGVVGGEPSEWPTDEAEAASVAAQALGVRLDQFNQADTSLVADLSRSFLFTVLVPREHMG